EELYKVVEMQLSLMHDVLYTKAEVMGTCCGRRPGDGITVEGRVVELHNIWVDDLFAMGHMAYGYRNVSPPARPRTRLDKKVQLVTLYGATQLASAGLLQQVQQTKHDC
ncbi:hypothetical protein C2845_PM16G01060, partial [Panicum miliaceum]